MGIQDMMILKYVDKLDGYLKRIAEASEKSAKSNERIAEASERSAALAECDHVAHFPVPNKDKDVHKVAKHTCEE
jgi:hypothetical protein